MEHSGKLRTVQRQPLFRMSDKILNISLPCIFTVCFVMCCVALCCVCVCLSVCVCLCVCLSVCLAVLCCVLYCVVLCYIVWRLCLCVYVYLYLCMCCHVASALTDYRTWILESALFHIKTLLSSTSKFLS